MSPPMDGNADVPEFLARLGLRPDAALRDVKRAYARELKRIDQEGDPQGFQELRAAYEAACAWAEEHARAKGDAPATPPRPVEAPPPAPAPTAQPPPPPPPAVSPPVRPTSAPPPRAAEPAPEAELRDADRLFRRLLSALAGGEDATRAALRAALADPALVHLDARFAFEQWIAARLAEGWAPGHEHLFTEAVEAFGWRDRHLGHLGAPGRALDPAIVEYSLHLREQNWFRAVQRDVLEHLRREKLPGTGDLVRMAPFVEATLGRHPAWVRVVAPAQAARRWLEAARRVPRWRRVLVRRWRPRAGPVYGQRKPPALVGLAVSGAMLLLLVTLFSVLTPDGPARRREPSPRTLAPASPARFSPAPAQPPTRWPAADLDPRTPQGLAAQCAMGAGAACNDLGVKHARGDGVPQDLPRAASLYEQACAAGDLVGCSNRALALELGRGVARDRAAAARLYSKACDGGIAAGCSGQAALLERTLEHDVTLSRAGVAALYRKGCDGGDGVGCNNLGTLLEYGAGVPSDRKEAAALFRRACDAGLGTSCANLAGMTADGRGVARDLPAAVALYERACTLSEPRGCELLGKLLRKGGAGVPADAERARTLLERACQLGRRSACAAGDGTK